MQITHINYSKTITTSTGRTGTTETYSATAVVPDNNTGSMSEIFKAVKASIDQLTAPEPEEHPNQD